MFVSMSAHVEKDCLGTATHHVDPDLPILHGIFKVNHAELVSKSRSVLLKTTSDLFLLSNSEELGSGRIVVHDEEGGDGCSGGGYVSIEPVISHEAMESSLTDSESENTLKDKNPSPARSTSDTSHLNNTSGEKASEGTSSCSGREKDGHAKTALMTSVPHGNAGNRGVRFLGKPVRPRRGTLTSR